MRDVPAHLEETKGCGVPLGVSVESVSIFRNEIDAAHELFRRTQSMLLDFLGEPWLVRYSIVDTKAKRTSFDYVRPAPPTAALPSTEEKPAAADEKTRSGVLVGAGLALGLVLGKVLRI